MCFKDILVQVNQAAPCRPRIELAAALALEHGAHLTGLGVKNIPHIPAFIMSQLGPDVAEAQRLQAEEALQAQRHLFQSIAERVGVPLEWRQYEGDLFDIFSLNGRYADLVVIGQEDRRDDEADGEQGLLDHVLLDTGCPVLVVPYAGTFASLGQSVMVAWNGTREAARAVRDALPFLKRAKRVDVVVVNPHTGRDGHGEVPGADLCLHLARQGVKATAHVVHAEDMNVGAMILSRVADEGADLLVMGGYGHSRLREIILGGVTRHILQHMTVPVLMSH